MFLLAMILVAAVGAGWWIFMATDRQREAVRDGVNDAIDFCVNSFNNLRDRIRCGFTV